MPSPSSLAQTPLQPFSEIVDSLDRTLAGAGYGMKSTKHDLPLGEFWTFGSVILNFPIRAIHGGFVEPLMRAPIIAHVPETVVAFLLEIPRERDLLDRERHNQVGWHYHYLDFKRARSDIVLCWDTHVVRQKGRDHPLFQETHGKGHAAFTARPDLWGPTKKKSMHYACAPDLDTWPLNDFRCASAKAGPVWPVSAILRPVATTIALAPKLSAKGGDKNSR